MTYCSFHEKIAGGVVGGAILELDAVFLAPVLYLVQVQVLSIILVDFLCQVKANSQLVSHAIDDLSGHALSGVAEFNR